MQSQKRKNKSRQEKKNEKLKSDPRVSVTTKSLSTSNEYGSELCNVVVEVPILTSQLFGILTSYVCYAYQRGYQPFADSGTYPYLAAMYGTSILQQYVKSTTPNTIKLPYWLAAIGDMISPLTVPFQQGKILYRYVLSDPDFVVPFTSPIGPPQYGYLLNLGYTDGNLGEDNFPVINTTNNYDPVEGQVAWASLMQFMENLPATDHSQYFTKMTTVGTKTDFRSNSSCYVLNAGLQGGGLLGDGPACLLQHEVPIFSPIFAVFAQPVLNGISAGNRWGVFDMSGATDPLWLAGMLSTFGTKAMARSKKYPRFHFIDFLELGDVLAWWVSLAIQTYVQSPYFGAKGESTINPTNLSCPLSLQEVLLLLRNVVMQAFKDTQPAVQAMYPSTPTGNTDNQFVSYTAGAGTCFLHPVPMQLPVPLVENIRALTMRTVNSKFDTLSFVPVLGQYYLDQLSSSDYLVTAQASDGTQIQVPAFSEGPYLRKQIKNAKVKDNYEMLTSNHIDLVDGYCSATNQYLMINDPKRLNELCTLWNNWTSGFISGVTSQRTVFGSEGGINVLTSINMTRYILPLDYATDGINPLHERKSGKNELVSDLRLIRNKRVLASNYSNRTAIAVSAQSPILATAYEQIQHYWVLPTVLIRANASPKSNVQYFRWQEIMGEPFTAPETSAYDGQDQTSIHYNYAQRMVRDQMAPVSDWEALFDEMAKSGRGGILSSLAADFAGAVLGSTAGTVAHQIANALPI